MQRRSAKYLDDMLHAAQTIQSYAKGKTAKDYLQEPVIRDAITWNYCIIGEALSQLNRIDEATAERITEHWKIIGLRNQLIHGYAEINHEVTWRLIETKLPILIAELEQLLKE